MKDMSRFTLAGLCILALAGCASTPRQSDAVMLARYQADAFRYFVCAAGPETSDSDFTWSEFVARTNNELVLGYKAIQNEF